MGEYAEIQWRFEARKGSRDPVRPREGRNPIATHCPICGKGIRPIAGCTRDSLAQHMKAKHYATKEPPQ